MRAGLSPVHNASRFQGLRRENRPTKALGRNVERIRRAPDIAPARGSSWGCLEEGKRRPGASMSGGRVGTPGRTFRRPSLWGSGRGLNAAAALAFRAWPLKRGLFRVVVRFVGRPTKLARATRYHRRGWGAAACATIESITWTGTAAWCGARRFVARATNRRSPCFRRRVRSRSPSSGTSGDWSGASMVRAHRPCLRSALWMPVAATAASASATVIWFRPLTKSPAAYSPSTDVI